MIETERMEIFPISIDKMKQVIEVEKDEELKKAYMEMLEGCLKNPKDHLWYTLWFMELKQTPHEIIGTLSFKGIDSHGMVEIGYGMFDGYKNKGYMTEAVQALVEWASKQPKVKRIEAEAEESNTASIRVLEKSNFSPNGIFGQEGIRFTWNG